MKKQETKILHWDSMVVESVILNQTDKLGIFDLEVVYLNKEKTGEGFYRRYKLKSRIKMDSISFIENVGMEFVQDTRGILDREANLCFKNRIVTVEKEDGQEWYWEVDELEPIKIWQELI